MLKLQINGWHLLSCKDDMNEYKKQVLGPFLKLYNEGESVDYEVISNMPAENAYPLFVKIDYHELHNDTGYIKLECLGTETLAIMISALEREIVNAA